MPTPQMTLRVEENRLNRWKAACEMKGISVSEQIRVLMDGWCEEMQATRPPTTEPQTAPTPLETTENSTEDVPVSI